MSQQTSMRRASDRPLAAGLPQGIDNGLDLQLLAGGEAYKVVTFTIDTAANDTVYTFLLQGSDGDEHTVSITSDSSATKTEIKDALVAAINGDIDIAGRVRATSTGADTFTVTGLVAGDDWSFTEADGNISNSVTTAASSRQDIEFGVAVCQPTTEGECLLPSVTTVAAVAQVMTLTPVAVNNAKYNVALTGDWDGDGEPETYVAEYLADASATVAEIVDGLVAQINALMPASSVLAANSADTLLLTAEVAGTPFEARGGSDNASATWTNASTTANVEASTTLDNPFLGVALRNPHTELDASGDSYHQAGHALPVRIQGPVPVRISASASPSPSASVYVRHTVTDSTTQKLGEFCTGTESGNAVLVSGARWLGSAKTGLGGVRVAKLFVAAA